MVRLACARAGNFSRLPLTAEHLPCNSCVVSETENSSAPARSKPHLYKPGQSGNPGGRKHAFRGYLKQLLGEHGEKGYDAILAMCKGEATVDVEKVDEYGQKSIEKRAASHRERLDGWIFLVEQLNGKSVSSLDVSAEITHRVESVRDYSKVTDDELTALERTLAKMEATDAEFTEGQAVAVLPAGEPVT